MILTGADLYNWKPGRSAEIRVTWEAPEGSAPGRKARDTMLLRLIGARRNVTVSGFGVVEGANFLRTNISLNNPNGETFRQLVCNEAGFYVSQLTTGYPDFTYFPQELEVLVNRSVFPDGSVIWTEGVADPILTRLGGGVQAAGNALREGLTRIVESPEFVKFMIVGIGGVAAYVHFTRKR